uniref:Ovule protein n=1 Tax=Parascaris univalens TaxID=6257 RepID=A0A915BZE5_PARUN
CYVVSFRTCNKPRNQNSSIYYYFCNFSEAKNIKRIISYIFAVISYMTSAIFAHFRLFIYLISLFSEESIFLSRFQLGEVRKQFRKITDSQKYSSSLGLCHSFLHGS